MTQYLINPWMLAGLFGIILPILAHLISRRRYDIVEWGAMRFLNPSRKTRRRMKLEELLLLLLRIGLISLVVLAVARPVISSSWLTGYQSSGSRCVVIVIDGSNSMSRTDGVDSIHRTAIRQVIDFLDTLHPGDTVAVIDARDTPRAAIESPRQDIQAVAEEVRRIPAPAGACGMLEAIEKAIGILGRSSASARDIIIFSDRQGYGWKPEDQPAWDRVDDLLSFPAIRPKLWMVDTTSRLKPLQRNIAVGRISMSREVTVTGFPIRISTTVQNNGDSQIPVQVRLLLDGQPLSGETQKTVIAAGAKANVEFNYAIRQEGSHVLSVEASAAGDGIEIDNVSHAAIRVEKSFDVMLVNGTPSEFPSDRDTFFVELAFAAAEGESTWVKTTVVDSSSLKPSDFQSVSVVMFCNVGEFSPEVVAALSDFVKRGNGVIISCGPNTSSDSFQKSFVDSGLLSGLRVVETRAVQENTNSRDPVRIATQSLQPGWLDRFHSDPSRSLLKATFGGWCVTQGLSNNETSAGQRPDETTTGSSLPGGGSLSDAEAVAAVLAGEGESTTADQTAVETPVVLARLNNGVPYILQQKVEDGSIILITSTLDRTWTDLPTRSDFVPFLHEAVFHVVSTGSRRNVDVSEPFVCPPFSAGDSNKTGLAEDQGNELKLTVKPPAGSASAVMGTSESDRSVAIFQDTFIPGVYRVAASQGDVEVGSEAFVVNYDHQEDDPTLLTSEEVSHLSENDRLRFSSSLSELTKEIYGDEGTLELWAILLTLFLLLLIGEVLLTRRSIRKGYGEELLITTQT